MSDAETAKRPAQDVTIRPARREDNAALLELFKAITMEADLHLAVERDPDFFALYDMERVEQRTIVIEADGKIEGLGTFLGRDGWLLGSRTRVGYAGDLRFAPTLRGGFVLGTHYGRTFREACRDFGCDAMLTAIIASNAAARRALVERSPRFPEKPLYVPFRKFTILSVHFTARGHPRPTELRVRRATEADLAPIAELLARDHARRPFGYVVDEGLLRERIARWPGLRVESFYVAHDREGRLLGVAAPWDAGPVKRFRVLAWRRSMKWVKRGFNLLARFTGADPLPGTGGLLRYFYLTHVSVEGEDPAVMAALLDRIYDDYHGKGYHFLTACVLDQDPLAPAYRGYRTSGLPAELYVVTEPGGRHASADFGTGRPGFEMALV